MPLTLEDIKRLTGKGYKVREFVVTCGGERKLRNLNGYCFFLDEGACSVYDERPTGCRLYPLVADWRGMVRIDPMCRHGDKFLEIGKVSTGLKEKSSEGKSLI